MVAGSMFQRRWVELSLSNLVVKLLSACGRTAGDIWLLSGQSRASLSWFVPVRET